MPATLWRGAARPDGRRRKPGDRRLDPEGVIAGYQYIHSAHGTRASGRSFSSLITAIQQLRSAIRQRWATHASDSALAEGWVLHSFLTSRQSAFEVWLEDPAAPSPQRSDRDWADGRSTVPGYDYPQGDFAGGDGTPRYSHLFGPLGAAAHRRSQSSSAATPRCSNPPCGAGTASVCRRGPMSRITTCSLIIRIWSGESRFDLLITGEVSRTGPGRSIVSSSISSEEPAGSPVTSAAPYFDRLPASR
jgi:hypothetical protein